MSDDYLKPRAITYVPSEYLKQNQTSYVNLTEQQWQFQNNDLASDISLPSTHKPNSLQHASNDEVGILQQPQIRCQQAPTDDNCQQRLPQCCPGHIIVSDRPSFL